MAGESLKELMVGMEKGSNAKCATKGTDSSFFDAGNASWMYVWNVACIAFSMTILWARSFGIFTQEYFSAKSTVGKTVKQFNAMLSL